MTISNNWLERFETDFRCVNCNSNHSLRRVNATLSCQQCGHQFKIADGRPLLLNESSQLALNSELEHDAGSAMVEEYQQLVQEPTKISLMQRCLKWLRPPDIMLHYNPDMTKCENTREIFTHQGPHTKILNVGGGPRRYSDNEVTLNIQSFKNVDCVGDGHRIPFSDNTFDSVICNAVLEHVHNPEQIVKEIFRVLKPGGRVYAEIPFMFFFHAYPNDFRRYTIEGMRMLFGAFDQAKLGLTHGPISAFLQNANMTLSLLVPEKRKILKKGVNGAFRWLFFSFKYLDHLFKKHPNAHLLAGGFWVNAMKPLANDGASQ